MVGSVVQMIRVVGFLLVLGMVHSGSAAAAGSSRNTRQECEDQLENTSCLDIKDKGKCDAIDPQLCRKTCGLCPVPSSGCPEGFFNPSWPSSQCFKVFDQPERNWRNWTEARELCILNGLTLATPNDDVNLEELSTYVKENQKIGWGDAVWLGGRGSASGFLWEAGVGEQPGSSSGRRGLDESHPGWRAGEPGIWVGNDWCLLMYPWVVGATHSVGSTPYTPLPCYEKAPTLCQL